jgi:hypothetical protein
MVPLSVLQGSDGDASCKDVFDKAKVMSFMLQEQCVISKILMCEV